MRSVFAALVFTALSQLSAFAAPAPLSQYVNDYMNLISPNAEAALAKGLALMRRDTGVQFTIVIIERMADYGHTGQAGPFAAKLFDEWGVGGTKKNDGAMMLVAMGDQQMRVELSASYRARLNVAVEEAVKGAVLPDFKQGAYVSGI